MVASRLMVGLAEVDITPGPGTRLLGGFSVREATGTTDPLLAKSLVAEAGGRRIALVGIDLALLPRELADPCIALAAQRTGIPPEAILLCATHTHTGPDTSGVFFPDAVDPEYMAAFPGRIAEAIAQAAARLQPVTMHIGRSLVFHGVHNRRVVAKDGLAINTWMPDMFNDLERFPQIVGSAGLTDPELWVARFDAAGGAEDGAPVGVLVNLSVHANARGGGLNWSADYPAVIAEWMRREYGPQVISVFLPGAAGDSNATIGGPRFEDLANHFAEKAVEAARHARPVAGPVAVDGVRCDLPVPRIDPGEPYPASVLRLNWGRGATFADTFEAVRQRVAAMPEVLSVPVSAFRVGPLGIASMPGEPFVGQGLKIKAASPFPHTIIAELANDDIGYMPTPEGFRQMGYEPLVGSARVSSEGVEQLVGKASALLEELWERGSRA